MKTAAFILLFGLLPLSMFPWGRKEQSNSMENTVKITGKVQIYGSVPHTYVGIIDEKGNQYSVYPPSKEEELMGLQGHLVEFTVVLLDEPQGYGSMFLKGGTVTPLEWEIIR